MKVLLQTLLSFLQFLFQHFMRNQGMEKAKSLTFTSLFAVVPLLTLIVSVLSLFPTFQVFGSEIENMIFQRLLPSTGSELETYLADFSNQAKNLTWVGAVMLVVTAYLMLVNIERSFNEIWGVRELRKGLSSFLLYWSVLSLSPLLLGLGFAISSYITSLTLFETFSEVSDLVGARSIGLAVFPIILTTFAFTLLFVAVPNCKVSLKHGLIGGLIVAISFTLVRKVFTWFIAIASYEFVYGTFAAIPIFLLWIYICWLVILLGANLVWAIPHYRAASDSGEVHPAVISLALLNKFWSKQLKGETVSLNELMQENWPCRDIQLEDFLDILIRKKLIKDCGQSEYVLLRDLDNLSLWDFLSVLPWQIPTAEVLSRPLGPILEHHLTDFKFIQNSYNKLDQTAQETFSVSIAQYFRSETA